MRSWVPLIQPIRMFTEQKVVALIESYDAVRSKLQNVQKHMS